VARKTEWLLRLPACVEALRRRENVVVDSKTLASLLKINLRSAQLLLQRFAAAEYGGMAERNTLIAGLERIARGEAETVVAETHRQKRLASILDDARGDLILHTVKIAPARDGKLLREMKVADLPPTIHITRGNISIDARDHNDYCRQAAMVCWARTNDLEVFCDLFEGPVVAAAPPPPPPQLEPWKITEIEVW